MANSRIAIAGPVRLCRRSRRSLCSLVCGVPAADDVNLVPGTTFKQAIGGRVRGQVQSESPSEVVVLLGATTTNVPTDQIQSIRYDGQSASFHAGRGPRSERATGRGGRAVQEGRGRVGRQAVSAQQAALFREAEVLTDLAMVEPDRVKEAKDKLDRVRADLSRPAATSWPRAAARPGSSCTPAISPGPRRRSPSWPSSPEAAERAAVLRTKILGQAGQARRGDRRARQADRRLSQGLGATAGGPARQGREPRGLKQFKEAETLCARGDPGQRHPKTRPPRHPPTTPWATASARPIVPRTPCSPISTPTCSTAKTRKSIPGPCITSSCSFASSSRTARPTSVRQRLKQEYPRSPWAASRAAEQ